MRMPGWKDCIYLSASCLAFIAILREVCVRLARRSVSTHLIIITRIPEQWNGFQGLPSLVRREQSYPWAPAFLGDNNHSDETIFGADQSRSSLSPLPRGHLVPENPGLSDRRRINEVYMTRMYLYGDQVPELRQFKGQTMTP